MKEVLFKEQLRNKSIYNLAKKRLGWKFYPRRFFLGPRVKENGDEITRLRPYLTISERLDYVREWNGQAPSTFSLVQDLSNDRPFPVFKVE